MAITRRAPIAYSLRRTLAFAVLALAVFGLAMGGHASARAAAATGLRTQGPAAEKAFDESGVSTGTGDDFTAAQWRSIYNAGFKLFITDPIEWSSECSDGYCTDPVNTCTVDSAAVAQIQDASNAGLDYAVYTRNPNCLTAAITGLSWSLQAHLSFAILDIETDPSVPPSPALISGVTALGQTPVFYSYQSAWFTITNNTKAYDSYPLQNGQVPNWNVSFPAAHPSGFPKLISMPYPYGGWSGHDADIEQQQCCTDVAGIDNPSDQVDLDAVNASWLSHLPHQNISRKSDPVRRSARPESVQATDRGPAAPPAES
jgi:hypothetical protein